MARALDHLVLGVADLETGGALFSALGFTVGPVNTHPWGTKNRLVQFADESFLELITVADPAAIPPHAPRRFSFGAFVRDALQRRTGLSMLVLKGRDARKDAADFAAQSIGDFEPFDFARKGVKADGSPTEVAFSLAFAADPAMPECAFFTCQHHFPENFWSKTAQTHANGARGVARVTIVADNPSDHHIFLGAFVGEREMRSTSFGIEIEAGHGVVEIISADGFAFRYGGTPPEAPTPRFAGIEIAVPDLGKVTPPKGRKLEPHAGGLSLAGTPEFATALRFVTEKP
jgi:hypothetical protein